MIVFRIKIFYILFLLSLNVSLGENNLWARILILCCSWKTLSQQQERTHKDTRNFPREEMPYRLKFGQNV